MGFGDNIVSADPFPFHKLGMSTGFVKVKAVDSCEDRMVEVGYQNGERDTYVDVHHVVKFPDSYRLTFMSEPGENNAERISLPDRNIKYVKTGKNVGMRPDRRVGDSE